MALIELKKDPTPREVRLFALVGYPLLCLVLGGVLFLKFGWHAGAYSIWTSAVVVALLGPLIPRATRYFYVGLMILCYPIGWVISHLVLAITYYGVITPIGLVFRLLGRDLLHRRFDPSTDTYWIEREEARDRRRYFRQF